MLLLGGVAGLTTDILVVFVLIAVTFVLFVAELVPVDVTALALIVALVVLEPWTQIGVARGLSGFSNEATITVLAMFMLSEGVRRSGAIHALSERVIAFAGGDERRQLVSVLGISGLSASVVNNTPVVAVLIPMAHEIAEQAGTALSKLLIPISYAAMLGGMLTLIGTSTSLLASSVSRRVIGRGFTMFEFTHLGALVLATGGAYLLSAGPHLLPDRRSSEEEITADFAQQPYLADVHLEPGAEWVGDPVDRIDRRFRDDAEIVQIVRDGQPLAKPLDETVLQARDELLVRAEPPTMRDLLETEGLHAATVHPGPDDIEAGEGPRAERLAEVVVVPQTRSQSPEMTVRRFAVEHDLSVLGIGRGEEVIHGDLESLQLRGGDTLLVLANERSLRRLNASRRFVVLQTLGRRYRSSKIPLALAIVAGVVAAAAAGLVPILVSALAGVVTMVATGCLRPEELYDAVDWTVIFLLAGVIPLGLALEETGGARLIADVVVAQIGAWPAPLVLAGIYLLTTIVTEMVSNNASVVLMIPIAVDVANQVGAPAFSFVLGVTFAASTSVLTPIGYQTNLMVYGAGGYRFTDFFRVGAPLQVLLTVVTTLGIWAFWGV